MRVNENALGEVERGQQQLKENIEVSTRLIGEAELRVATSRAFTAASGENAAVTASSPETRVEA